MFTINYNDDFNNVESESSVSFSKDANLIEIIYGFIKICKFAGYSEKSFDHIIDEFIESRKEADKYDMKYRFVDYIDDCLQD